MKIPLAICLFTSTRGHFQTSRYLETLNHISKQIPLSNFAGLFANIKITDQSDKAETDLAAQMTEKLVGMGFKVTQKVGYWKHGDQIGSHQSEYLRDIFDMYQNPQVLENQYVLHAEDDWLLEPSEGKLIEYIHKAINLLENNPDILQVRFPRFSNEFDRINRLKFKHNIDTWARWVNEDYFVHSDFSLNPSIFRSRDLRNAILLMKKNPNSFGNHVEHDFGRAVKYFSHPQESLICLNPSHVRAYHIGSELGKEDKIGEILNSD